MFKQLNESIKAKQEQEIEAMLEECTPEIDVDTSAEAKILKDNIDSVMKEINANTVDSDEEDEEVTITDEVLQHELNKIDEITDEAELDDDDDYDEDLDDELLDNEIKKVVFDGDESGIEDINELVDDDDDETLDEEYSLAECATLLI